MMTVKKRLLLPFLMFGMLACQAQHDEIKVETLAKSTLLWNDSTLIAYPQGQPEITVLKIDIPPHTQLDMHKHPVINAGVLLKGELTVIADNKQQLNLKAGDALIELVDTYHYGMNKGDETAQIIVFYAGIKGAPITEYEQKH